MANMLNVWDIGSSCYVTMGTQNRCRVSRLKISLAGAQGAWSVCPMMDVSSLESSCGGEWLYLSVRMFPSSFLYCIHPMLVSQRSALQPGCMWGGFCRFLSSGLSTLFPPSHLKRQLRNSTRISGLQELYSPHPHVAPSLSLSLSLLSIPPDTHFILTIHMLEAHFWSGTYKSRHTHTTKAVV